MNKERIAVVTGGTRGIGAAISSALKHVGFKVVANFVANEDKALAFANSSGIYIKKWDVSDYEQCRIAINEIIDKFGPISTLINNAGIIRDSLMRNMSYKNWYDVINVNLGSCFNMCSNVIKCMIEQKYGCIVNMSSISGQMGQIGQVNYSAAKAGIIGFTKSLAKECANNGITVNAIAPGYIDTDMTINLPQKIKDMVISTTPMRRSGKPEEIARVVEFLATSSSFITGQVIAVNGGMYV